MHLRSIIPDYKLKQPISAKSLTDEYLFTETALLSSLRDSIPLRPDNLIYFLKQVSWVANRDPSILDWLIEGVVDRSLNFRPHLLSSLSGRQNRVDLPIIKQQTSILKFKKIFAYVYSGHTNFLLSLATVDLETLSEASEILARTGTVREFEIFLNRADAESISNLFNSFWFDHRVAQCFEGCALMLLDCVDRIPPPDPIRYTIAEKLLKYPAVLSRALSVGVRVHFGLHFLKDSLKCDDLFQKIPLEIYKSKFSSVCSLKLFGPQIDRMLDILQITADQYLQRYWRNLGNKKVKISFRYAIRTYSFLKRWKRDSPEEYSRALATDSGQFDEQLSAPRLMKFFNEEARELLKAHLLFGSSIRNNQV